MSELIDTNPALERVGFTEVDTETLHWCARIKLADNTPWSTHVYLVMNKYDGRFLLRKEDRDKLPGDVIRTTPNYLAMLKMAEHYLLNKALN